MRLQVKDIVLSDSLDITPLHLHQAKRLLTGPLQNKFFETQRANSRDYPRFQRLLAFPQQPLARLLRHLTSIHFAYRVLRLASLSYFQHRISTTSIYVHRPSSMELIDQLVNGCC